jgi:hypothetical protein
MMRSVRKDSLMMAAVECRNMEEDTTVVCILQGTTDWFLWVGCYIVHFAQNIAVVDRKLRPIVSVLHFADLNLCRRAVSCKEVSEGTRLQYILWIDHLPEDVVCVVCAPRDGRFGGSDIQREEIPFFSLTWPVRVWISPSLLPVGCRNFYP